MKDVIECQGEVLKDMYVLSYNADNNACGTFHLTWASHLRVTEGANIRCHADVARTLFAAQEAVDLEDWERAREPYARSGGSYLDASMDKMAVAPTSNGSRFLYSKEYGNLGGVTYNFVNHVKGVIFFPQELRLALEWVLPQIGVPAEDVDGIIDAIVALSRDVEGS